MLVAGDKMVALCLPSEKEDKDSCIVKTSKDAYIQKRPSK